MVAINITSMLYLSSMKKNTKNKFVPYARFKKELLKNTVVKKVYDDLGFEFKIISALIDARSKKNLTQKELAQKIGIAQSALARFEAGRVNPTLAFIQKITSGLGLKLTIK
jgi:ribosome-binding protein aMBF1 (putative translation factor)